MSEVTDLAPEESVATPGQDDWLDDADTEELKDTEGGDKPAEETAKDEPEGEQPLETDEDKPENPDDPTPANPNEEDAEAAKKTEDEAVAEQKRHNDEQAKLRIQGREAVRNAAQQFADNAKSAIEDAGDDDVKRELAELKAKEAQREADDFVRNVEHTQSVMSNDYSRVAHEVSMFRPANEDGSPNPEYNERAYNLALEHLAPHLVTQEVAAEDGNKQLVILGTNVSVYDFLKNEAESMKALMGDVADKSAVAARQAARKQHAAADPTGGSAPKKSRESDDDKEAREMGEAFGSI